MADHTISGGPWPHGTTVSVYRRRTTIPQDDVGVPSGQSVVSTGEVDTNALLPLTGLVGGERYWAVGRDSDARWRWMAVAVRS